MHFCFVLFILCDIFNVLFRLVLTLSGYGFHDDVDGVDDITEVWRWVTAVVMSSVPSVTAATLSTVFTSAISVLSLMASLVTSTHFCHHYNSTLLSHYDFYLVWRSGWEL